MTSLAVLMTSLALADVVDFAKYRLSVDPPAEDTACVVLQAELPRVPDHLARAGSSELIETGEAGKRVPFQFVQGDSGTRVVFTPGWIKKGTAASWNLTIHCAVTESTARIAVALPGRFPDPPQQGFPTPVIEVRVGADLFTRLLAEDGLKKPVLYPIQLQGLHMTRRYPQEKGVNEDEDHIHHRGLWFDHGDVNGADFWAEQPGEKKGTIYQKEVISMSSGDASGTISTWNMWVGPDSKYLLDESRILTFYDFAERGRAIDVTCVLVARIDPVTFGDTKEGSFGIRLAESMKEKRGGRIENSRGKVSMKETWGKPAEWIDYTGEVDGKTVGVAIFDHPQSFRHPTTWHVRDYGLFAANPFGLKDFTGDKTKDGSHKLEKGQSITFKYRVLLHPGTTAESNVAAAYRAFASPPKVKVERVERAKE